jgi:hypothetical protein
VSALKYQTVCNDIYLGPVQTKKCFYRRHNTADVRKSKLLHDCLQQFVILAVFTPLIRRPEKKNLHVIRSFSIRSDQLLYSPCTTPCRSVTHSVQ